MSMWTNYAQPSAGVAGGLYDLTEHVIDSRTNEEATRTLKPGMGVVQGTAAGKKVKLPATGAQLADFEGVLLNDVNRELDKDGNLFLEPKSTVSVMRSGRIWVSLAEGATPKYGDSVFLVINGAGLGCFKQEADSANTLEINARFLGAKDGNIAPIELYSQK